MILSEVKVQIIPPTRKKVLKPVGVIKNIRKFLKKKPVYFTCVLILFMCAGQIF